MKPGLGVDAGTAYPLRWEVVWKAMTLIDRFHDGRDALEAKAQAQGVSAEQYAQQL